MGATAAAPAGSGGVVVVTVALVSSPRIRSLAFGAAND
jgi:hypothetical protein